MDNQEAPQNPTPQTTQPVVPPSNPTLPVASGSRKKLMIFGLVGILLLLGIGAGIYVFTMNNKQPTTDNQQQVRVVPTTHPTPVDSTAEWETYTNTQYKFSFKHPSDWRIVSPSQEPKAQDIFIAYDSSSKDSYLKQNPGGIDMSQQTIEVVNGIEVTRIKNNKDVYQREYAIISLPNGTLKIEGTLDFETNTDQISTFDQIISTFKFTDSDQAMDTSTWRTYTDLENKFSIKYPSTWSMRDLPSGAYGDKLFESPDFNAPVGVESGASVLTVVESKKFNSIKEWLPNVEEVNSKSFDSSVHNPKTITINGYSAGSYETTGLTFGEKVTGILNNQTVYEFILSHNSNKNHKEIYQKMLESFTIIK